MPVMSTAQLGNGTSATDITGMTITFTAVANRRYRIMALCVTQQSGAGAGVQNLYVRNGANTIIGSVGGSEASANFATWVCITIDTPGAGSVTYKASIITNANTVDIACSTTQPAILTVEDFGPSANPV